MIEDFEEAFGEIDKLLHQNKSEMFGPRQEFIEDPSPSNLTNPSSCKPAIHCPSR